MNRDQLMIASRQKQLSALPKTKLLKEQILAFQSTLINPFDKKYGKISVQNKKKTRIHKTKTMGVFDDKQSLTDCSKDKEAKKMKRNNIETITKLKNGVVNDESAIRDLSICSLSIQTDDKNKEEDKESEVGNSKRMLEKHVLNTKYSLKKLMPELKTIPTNVRDLSVKERRPLISMFLSKPPLIAGGHQLMFEKSANSSGWNSNNPTAHVQAQVHTNKFQVVKKEKTLTLLKIKENKFIKEAREREKEREKERERQKENEPKNNDECFCYEEEKPCELTEDEKLVYGNREMRQHKKQSLLGKGGCGIVWKCINTESSKHCAVKQISKKTKDVSSQMLSSHNNFCQIAKNEIEMLTLLNKDEKCPYIVDIYNSYEDNCDIWFSFEMGGKSLSSLCFKIKGEFHNSERVYSIKKGNFLVMMMSDKLRHFKTLIRALLEAIRFISDHGIVHSDIKPENILIEYSDDQSEAFAFNSIKVIDFGSAFYVTSMNSLSSNTPEYMSPEVTEFIELNTMNKEKTKIMNELTGYPWSIDIWSLGVTLLEMVLSCPIWMSYKAKVVINGKRIFKTGLFGFKGRDNSKIHQKQIEVSRGLHKLLMQSLISDLAQRDLFEDLLSKMLSINPKTRISPSDALNHPFLAV